MQEHIFGKAESLPEVIVIGEFPFPVGNAAANNLQGHCKAIRTAGFTVGVLPSRVSTPRSDLESPPTSDNYRGIPYWHISRRHSPTKLRRFVSEHLADDNPRLNWLARSHLKGVKTIIAYPGVVGSTPFLFRLRRLCRTHAKRLLAYVVEWHDRRHFQQTGATFCALDSELQRRVANLFLDGLICITKSLQVYYLRRGQRAFLIPPLLDLSDPKWLTDPARQEGIPFRPLRLLFSGTCARDRHDIMLRAVRELRQRGAPITVEYLGSSKDDVAQTPGVRTPLLDSLGDGLQFHGRVPDNQVHAVTSSASFAIMLRDEARWSRSCFPSRISECCALGVPMLCNWTSDLADYLSDGVNAIVVSDVSVGGFCHALQRALALTKDQLQNMKNSARVLAEQFDGSHYAHVYKDILTNQPLKVCCAK